MIESLSQATIQGKAGLQTAPPILTMPPRPSGNATLTDPLASPAMPALSPAHLRLVAITDRWKLRGDMQAAVEAALDGGATAIMLREKDLPPAELYELALAIRKATMAREAALIVNRSVEVALAVGAEAVHLGSDALDPTTVMTIAGERLSIGLSAHGDREVREAAECGLAYVSVSPIFAPTSKQSPLTPIGVEGLQHICALAQLPVLALGGMTPRNARACFEAGAIGVAAIGGLLGSDDPRNAAREFRKAMDP